MLLKKIIEQVEVKNLLGDIDRNISSVTLDSREVKKNALFVATKGTILDSHSFIPQVTKNRVGAIVCEDLPDSFDENITYIQVKNTRDELGKIASAFYSYPSAKIDLIGVTGTNGKTTCATLMNDLFTNLGYKTSLISTICIKILNNEIPSSHTTPDAITLNRLLKQMVDAGSEYCFMEVSSHALDMGRVGGLKFKGAVFTNITHDHLDYHGNFRNYLYTKKLLFDNLLKDGFALVNADDKNSGVMVQNTSAKKYTYSLRSSADFIIKIIEQHFDGTLIRITGKDIWVPIIGNYNMYNLLAVFSIAILLGVEQEKAVLAISSLRNVKGRFDTIKGINGVFGIVDYAHTPDALLKIIQAIIKIKNSSQQLITIIGCGGNRDKEKRPKMGFIAANYSDKVILTADNPRDETPEEIIMQMKEGVAPEDSKKILAITDRKEAIKTAVMFSKANDIVLLAGKGHEKYQIISSNTIAFDDKQQLTEALN